MFGQSHPTQAVVQRNFLSSKHEELAEYLTRRMTSKTPVNANPTNTLVCASPLNNEQKKMAMLTDSVSSTRLMKHFGTKKRHPFSSG